MSYAGLTGIKPFWPFGMDLYIIVWANKLKHTDKDGPQPD